MYIYIYTHWIYLKGKETERCAGPSLPDTCNSWNWAWQELGSPKRVVDTQAHEPSSARSQGAQQQGAWGEAEAGPRHSGGL